MTLIGGVILHALLFALLHAFTELQWYWAALISGLVVWFGILVIGQDPFDW